MGRTDSQKVKKLRANSERQIWHQKQRKCLALMALAVGAVALAVYPTMCKQPENTSKLSGQDWVEELLEGHPGRFHNNMGMNKHVFLKLVDELGKRAGLGPTRWVSPEEQLSIFLYTCVTGLSTVHLKEHFQRSKDTISRSVLPSLIFHIQSY